MKKIKVGVIGAGNIAFYHIRGLQMVGVYGDYEADMVIIADPDVEAANRLGKRFGFRKITADWKEVVNDPEVEVVSIVTPNCTHAEIAIAAAKAGKSVMLEKPMAMNRDEDKAIEKAFADTGVVNMVDFIYRTVPANVEAKKLVEAGRLGQITAFRGWFDASYKADPEKELQWRDVKALAGTGALGDVIAHVISLSDLITGSQLGEIVEVCADMDTVYKTRKDMSNNGEIVDIDTDDICTVLVRYENGRTGLIYASRIATGHDCYMGYEIQGSNGMLRFNLDRINELEFFETGDYETKGFKTVLGNPSHGDYSVFTPYDEMGISYADLFSMHYQKLFKAIELGPYGYFPINDIQRVAEELNKNQIGISVGVIFDELVTDRRYEELRVQVDQICNLLKKLPKLPDEQGQRRPTPYLTLMDFGHEERNSVAGHSELAPRADKELWKKILSHIKGLSEIANNYGVRPVVHPHSGGYIEFDDEIEKFVNDLPDDLVGLCLDTGHIQYSGANPAELLKKYKDRLDYVHFKDINGKVYNSAMERKLKFLNACHEGAFCPIGQGIMDYKAVSETLINIGYNGYICIEQERDPKYADEALKTERASIEFLKGIGFEI
jgi:inosose dehydratase